MFCLYTSSKLSYNSDAVFIPFEILFGKVDGTHTHIASTSATHAQRYTYRLLQTIQMKLILLCVWAEPAVLGSAKTALKFKYET
jgi:hypothetical protein